MNTVEKWGLFEVSLKGPSAGNPFTEQSVSATFRSKNEIVTVDGFYDGDGVYKVRFMPSFTGDYVYETVGSFPEAESAGDFTVTEPTGNNHGPVRIANTYHFAYEDTTPYYSVGTTCYAWAHQPEEVHKQTLEELDKGYFNKCVSASFRSTTSTISATRRPSRMRAPRSIIQTSPKKTSRIPSIFPATTGILRVLTPSIFAAWSAAS